MQIHTLYFLPPDWMQLAQQLSQLDRFDARWQAIERREQKTLKELKSIATVRSVGASTRIEGSKMTDKEVERLIENLDIKKLTERDKQEVIGYYDALNLIGESYRDIPISESSIKHLHNILLKYSSKDQYHRGDYKINSNRVEKTMPDGTKIPVFETTPPGIQTQTSMAGAVAWYNNDAATHALIRAAIFVYEFLSIHPFQDGNGRMSRLITNLLLMKSGYVWIEYVSFEHEIEHRKKEYYQVLIEAQKERPGENVTSWVYFFLDCLKNIQHQLIQKIEEKKRLENVGTREQYIYAVIENNPGIRSGEVAEKLNIPLATVKRIIADMVKTRNIVVHGAGRGTSYSIAVDEMIKTDISMRFTNDERVKKVTFPVFGSFLRIKKIVLTPLFKWEHPYEWERKLLNNGLHLIVTANSSNGAKHTQTYDVHSYVTPNNYQPVLLVAPNILLPDHLQIGGLPKITYPVECTIELKGSVHKFDFEISLITDQG